MKAPHRRVASLRHTVILIAILLGIAAYGVYSDHANKGSTNDRGSPLLLYLSVMAAEWALVRYMAVGTRKAGIPFRDLLGERWLGWKDVGRDIAVAAAVWVAWTAGAATVAAWIGDGNEATRDLRSLFPEGPLEITAWIALSLTAGFCEEVVYRGYLQRQFEALSGSIPVAILGQAALFGISHGYQGVRNVIIITIYGVLFGLLAWWRKSLKPGMILHAWTDVFGGLFERRF